MTDPNEKAMNDALDRLDEAFDRYDRDIDPDNYRVVVRARALVDLHRARMRGVGL